MQPPPIIAVLDAISLAMDGGREDSVELFADFATCRPGRYRAAPLLLFGWHAWPIGNGTPAGLAAEAATKADPGYSAADLLLAALTRGVGPTRLARIGPNATCCAQSPASSASSTAQLGPLAQVLAPPDHTPWAGSDEVTEHELAHVWDYVDDITGSTGTGGWLWQFLADRAFRRTSPLSLGLGVCLCNPPIVDGFGSGDAMAEIVADLAHHNQSGNGYVMVQAWPELAVYVSLRLRIPLS